MACVSEESFFYVLSPPPFFTFYGLEESPGEIFYRVAHLLLQQQPQFHFLSLCTSPTKTGESESAHKIRPVDAAAHTSEKREREFFVFRRRIV